MAWLLQGDGCWKKCKTVDNKRSLHAQTGSENHGTLLQQDRLIETSKQQRAQLLGVEMSEKKTIRVIKKDERTRKQKPAVKEATPRQTAREMVQTVTNWVNEVQQKRRVETANAIKLMLSENPRTSEA